MVIIKIRILVNYKNALELHKIIVNLVFINSNYTLDMRLLIKFLFIYQFIVSYNSFSQQILTINENSKLVTIKSEDNSVFVGKIDGVNKKGILTFSNGNKHIGYWRKDTLKGFGKKIYFDGKIEQGIWSRGILKTKYESLEFYDDGGIKTVVKEKNNGNWSCVNFFPNQKEKSISYYENSKLKSEHFWNSINRGMKKVINYDEFGKLNGDYIVYQEPIINAEGDVRDIPYDTIGKYVNGKREGEWVKKYQGGSNLNMSEFIYDNDKLIKKISYSYYSDKNNKVSESFYENGKVNKIIEYYDNGKTKREELFSDELIFIKYYNDFDEILSGSYTISKKTQNKEGESIDYYKNGIIKEKDFYKNNNIIYSYSYFENGNINKYNDNNKSELYNINGNKVFFIDLTTNQGFRLYENGQKWEGVMDRRLGPNGYGKYSFPNGENFIGFYNLKDNFFGKGEYFWANGQKYVGNFKKGEFDGYGKMTYPDGSINEGIWANGNLINNYNKTPIASNKTSKTSLDKKNYDKSKSIVVKNSISNDKNHSYSKLNISDEESVSKYMMGKTWSCSDIGNYTLNFTYDYCSRLNTYGLIFWTMDRSNPWNFINVNFEPGYNYAKISGMNPENGDNIIVYLFPDGHCENPSGKYYRLN